MCSYWCMLLLIAVALDQLLPLQASSTGCGEEDLIGTTDPKLLKLWRPSRKYPHNVNCVYRISVGEGYRILVTVTKIDTQPGHDFLQIFDGTTPQRHRQIAKLSGYDSDLKYQSNGTVMTITFTTDDRVAYRGYSLTYQKVPCKSCHSATYGNGGSSKKSGGGINWFWALIVVCLVLLCLIIPIIRRCTHIARDCSEIDFSCCCPASPEPRVEYRVPRKASETPARSDEPRQASCSPPAPLQVPDDQYTSPHIQGPPPVYSPMLGGPNMFPYTQGDPRMFPQVPAVPSMYPNVPYGAQPMPSQMQGIPPMPADQQMPSAPQAPGDSQTSAGKEAVTVKNITVNIN